MAKKRKRDNKARLAKSHPPGRGTAKAGFGLSGNRACLVWTGAIFLLHALGLVFLFNPIRGIFNSAPLIDQDWGLHFHHLKSLEAFWREDRRLWGYNPLFMAGYPSNTIQDLSIKTFELSALLLSSLALTSMQWFKLLAFLAVASVPWLVYFTARNFWDRHDFKTIAPPLAALFGTAYWWNSLPREMFF